MASGLQPINSMWNRIERNTSRGRRSSMDRLLRVSSLTRQRSLISFAMDHLESSGLETAQTLPRLDEYIPEFGSRAFQRYYSSTVQRSGTAATPEPADLSATSPFCSQIPEYEDTGATTPENDKLAQSSQPTSASGTRGVELWQKPQNLLSQNVLDANDAFDSLPPGLVIHCNSHVAKLRPLDSPTVDPLAAPGIGANDSSAINEHRHGSNQYRWHSNSHNSLQSRSFQADNNAIELTLPPVEPKMMRLFPDTPGGHVTEVRYATTAVLHKPVSSLHQ